MAEAFERPGHRQVLNILRGLDRPFLKRCEILFAGGTRIALELGEYRESKNIDFLCASQAGYRLLRESVSGGSLGPLARKPLTVAREVRADQYGVRTWLSTGKEKIKFEIVRGARIAIAGMDVPRIPVPCLDHAQAFAEKFLANADRGLDAATLSRDAVDLAFMIEGWAKADATAGYEIACTAYGKEVGRKLAAVTSKLRTDRKYRNQCVEAMAIEDTKTLSRGLESLARYATQAA